MINTAYSKRVPIIKLVLTKEEYNNLIEVLTQNIESKNIELQDIAKITKEKFLKYGIPQENDKGEIEINLKLYVNEIIDIVNQLLSYINDKVSKNNYYQVLLKLKDSNSK